MLRRFYCLWKKLYARPFGQRTTTAYLELL